MNPYRMMKAAEPIERTTQVRRGPDGKIQVGFAFELGDYTTWTWVTVESWEAEVLKGELAEELVADPLPHVGRLF